MIVKSINLTNNYLEYVHLINIVISSLVKNMLKPTSFWLAAPAKNKHIWTVGGWSLCFLRLSEMVQSSLKSDLLFHKATFNISVHCCSTKYMTERKKSCVLKSRNTSVYT